MVMVHGATPENNAHGNALGQFRRADVGLALPRLLPLQETIVYPELASGMAPFIKGSSLHFFYV